MLWNEHVAAMFVIVAAAAACQSMGSEAPPADAAGGAGYGGRGGPSSSAGATGAGATGAGATGAGVAGAGVAGAGVAGAGVSGSAGRAGSGSGGVDDPAGPGGGSAGQGGANEPGNGGSGNGGTVDSGGEGGLTGEAGAPSGREFAYLSTLLGDLLMCEIDTASGSPSLLPGSPIDSPGYLHGVFVDHSGKFLFTLAEPTRIDTYLIATDGTLPAEPSSTELVASADALMTMALEPKGRFAYAASPYGKTLYSFAIDADSGALTAIGAPLSVGPAPDHRSPAYVAAEPGGNFVYVSQLIDPSAPEADNGIRGYRIDQDTGELAELDESPFGGGSVIAGAIVFTPDGKFLYNSGGGLHAFAIDPDSGNLTQVAGEPFTLDVGSDPWASNLAMDPQGEFVYVSRFLLTDHISGFAIDPDSGVLDEVPGSPVTSSAPYSIAIEPHGRFLYVGNDFGLTPVFSIDRADGSLTETDDSPFQFGGLETEIGFVTLP